jgi:TetR/AcrR family transcriptional regulator, regulator of autoinduction and epiphytic fitness
MSNQSYLDGLTQISEVLGGWIEAAQKSGALRASLPSVLVLYTLYARACDPVPQFLKAGGQHSDEQIIELVISTCFEGING